MASHVFRASDPDADNRNIGRSPLDHSSGRERASLDRAGLQGLADSHDPVVVRPDGVGQTVRDDLGSVRGLVLALAASALIYGLLAKLASLLL